MIEDEIKTAIKKALGDLSLKIEAVGLERPADVVFGDYSSNIALVGFSSAKESLAVNSPCDLAEKIAVKLKANKGLASIVDKIEVAKPGFINFFLSQDYLFEKLKLLLALADFKKDLADFGKGKTMVIDYSAPNIAKSFGIGHLRSTNIGQSIYNLYQILGYKTIGDNHLGDWGTQFGKLIYAIISWWDKDLDDLTIKDLEKLYVRFHKQAKKDPKLADYARSWFKKLEQGDKKAKEIWQYCVKVSLKEFSRVYKILGVNIDYAYGEAFYHFEGWTKKVLIDVKKKGLLQESQGAKVMKLPNVKIPGMLVKSDGASTYLLRDLATIKYRVETWSPDLIVYEVGADQKLYFQQVFAAAELLGYIKKKNLVHVAHGLIRWKSGKFSTRSGETIHLTDVLSEAIARAKQVITQSQTSKDLTEQEKSDIAQKVGIGGIKFNDLKQEPARDIVFDWDRIISLEGYSGPYLQYAYTRCVSVISKSQTSDFEFSASKLKLNPEELNLLRAFSQFPEIIITAAKNFAPYFICQYLFELAQKFNLFYQKHKIIDPENKTRQDFRLGLTQAAANSLKLGLKILGIEVLNKM